MTREQTIEYVNRAGLFDGFDGTIRDQLDARVHSIRSWEWLRPAIYLIPTLGYLAERPILFLSLLVSVIGAGWLFLRDAKRMEEAVQCFDRYDARTLHDLVSSREAKPVDREQLSSVRPPADLITSHTPGDSPGGSVHRR